MRKVLLSLTCAVSLYAEQMYLYEVSPIIGLSENGTSLGLERSAIYGVEFQYNDIDFVIKPELTYIFSPNIGLQEESMDVNGHLLMLNGVYDVEYTALLTPFIKAGIGYQSLSNNPEVDPNAFIIDTGAGLKLNIVDKIALKFEAVITLRDFSQSNILAYGGLDISFGNEDNTPVPKEVFAEPLEHNTTKAPKVVAVTETIYISKEDYNLTTTHTTNQEVVVRDNSDQINSLTIFVPYLFRGFELDDASITLIKEYAKELREHPNSTITIIGHTDAKGRRAFNKELSLKRANEVRTLLVDQGIDIKRIHVEGRGESDPIAEKNNPAANRLNKRIEIKISYPKE